MKRRSCGAVAVRSSAGSSVKDGGCVGTWFVPGLGVALGVGCGPAVMGGMGPNARSSGIGRSGAVSGRARGVVSIIGVGATASTRPMSTCSIGSGARGADGAATGGIGGAASVAGGAGRSGAPVAGRRVTRPSGACRGEPW